jgi:hypothetical protein
MRERQRALIARGEAERTRRRVAPGVEGLDIAPGTIVAVADEPGRWRVASSSVVGLETVLELVPLAAAPVAMAASSGAVLAAPDLVVGQTLLVAAELPGPEDVALTGPRISVMATGEGAGWRQAALLYSLDDGASWSAAGGTAAPAIIGRVEGGLAAASALLVDRRSRLVVTLQRSDMALGDADPASLALGVNLALVGDELIQFERAEPLGTGRWALMGLRRGLRGSEAAIGLQAAGDRFALLESDGVATIEVPLAAIGRQVRILASGVGDGQAPAEVSVLVTGASVAPPPPVQARARQRSDGALAVSWTRRSRTGGAWRDGVDVPLTEEAEAYRVTFDGSDSAFDVTAPELLVPAAERPAGATTIRIVQRGTLAASPPATIIL